MATPQPMIPAAAGATPHGEVREIMGGCRPEAEAVAGAAIASGKPEQREMAEWAIARFAAAGPALPRVGISFPESNLSECGGVPARAYLDQEPAEVRICWNVRLMRLHEIAHVWEVHNASPSLHEPFMGMRHGVESWAGADEAWAERGREHAANVIARGLLEDPYPISRTYPNDAASLMAAFRFLTGTDPLHDGGTDVEVADGGGLFASRTNAPLESGR